MFVCVFPFLWWQRPWNLGQGQPEAAVAISKDLICKFFEKRLQLQWVFRGLGFSLDHCQSVYTFFLALTMPLRVVWKKKVCLVNSVWCGHIEFRARNVFGVGRYICQRACHISHFFASSLETFTTAASFLMALRQESLTSMLYWRWEKIEMDSLWDTVLLEMQEKFFSKKWWKRVKMTKVIDELKGCKLSGFPCRNLLTEWQGILFIISWCNWRRTNLLWWFLWSCWLYKSKGIVSKCKGASANKN